METISRKVAENMQQQKVIRTKMSAALIKAVHQSIDTGHNTGRLGRMVLTNEAKGVGIKFSPRPKAAVKKAAS